MYLNKSIVHHLGKVEAYKRYKGFGKLTVQYDFQINRRKEFDLRRGDLKNTPVIDLRLFTTSLQPNLQIDYFDNLKINTGLLVRYQQNDAVSGTGTSPLIPDFDKYDAGMYAIGNYNLNETTEISAGIRYDFTDINAKKNTTLQIGKKPIITTNCFQNLKVVLLEVQIFLPIQDLPITMYQQV